VLVENRQYLQAFLDESFENVQILNSICLKIEQASPVDDDFAAMFRAAHTLKGMCATMGFANMANLTHKLEDALGYWRQHPARLTSEAIDLIFAAIDALEEDLQSVADGSADTRPHEELIAQLTAAVAAGDSAGSGEVAATAAPAQSNAALVVDDAVQAAIDQCKQMGLLVGVLTVYLDERCQMKGPRAIMVSRALENHGQCLACWPPAEVMESGTFTEHTLTFLVALEADAEGCITSVQNISEIQSVAFTPYDEWAQRASAQSTATTNGASRAEAARSSTPGRADRTERVDKLDRTIRVPVERLDVLMNYLSELVIDRTRLAALAQQAGNAELKELADHLSRIASDLQSAVMSLRMVPVETLFQRFPRMVRDLAKTLNKAIRLEMGGMDTEFDRTIIDEMGEVLVHLIRNSADHGLEAPEERIARGKPAEGTIWLRAYSSGQNVYLEVADDGAGINVEKVVRRAVERGLISEAQAAKLTTKQVYELLFASGFSTADQVSDISGRGVGLDAVRDKVQALGGHIDIESERGRGTVFRIQLPLTLSVLRSLLFTVDGDTFAVPLGSVEEVVHATDAMLANVHGKVVLDHAGKLTPLLDLGEWFFGRPCAGDKPWKVVVCREGSRRIGLVVDRFVGQQEIVHKSLGTYLRDVPWFAGATILGDGSIALIVDVHAVMRNFLDS
jgi:two-component system chemotaxis sensor kinase CheA